MIRSFTCVNFCRGWSYQIIQEFVKCHEDHPIAKFFGKCTNLKIKLDKCFRLEKEMKRKANFEQSKKMQERLKAQRAARKAQASENPIPE
ncbi:hypothetical protein KP509_30G053300 [Ceratopteris richardii]|uniref:COX assembly mitochondrial protein n=1 Tax=Ceratopteris richardii TaxID=49495 RepID=A0A8T2R463_CERRI|nr:hypothetical protein KP509_30G053300 [Ceratopteris richardii]